MAISYTFGDLKTGAIIEEIPLFGVSMSDAVNSYGELRGSYQLDMTGKQNSDLLAASIPGKCYVVAELGSVPIWSGIVWSRTYQATSKTLQLYCKSFEAYPSKRTVRSNFSFEDEQTAIFIYYWDWMQDRSNGSLLVELPPMYAIQSVVKTSVVKASEYKTYEQVLNALADGTDGFDWRINVVKTAGVYRRIMQLGYPMIGALASSTSVAVEYPGSIVNYWATESMGSAGTEIDVLGAGEGSAMLTGRVEHAGLLSSGWIRYDVTVNYKDVTSQDVLNDLAAQEGANRKAPAMVLKVEVKGGLDPAFGSFASGDYMHVRIDDSRFNKFDGYKRLLRREYWPESSDGVEHAILTFEGEE